MVLSLEKCLPKVTLCPQLPDITHSITQNPTFPQTGSLARKHMGWLIEDPSVGVTEVASEFTTGLWFMM